MIFVLLCIGFPIVSGLCLLAGKEVRERKRLLSAVAVCFLVSAVFLICALENGIETVVPLLRLTQTLALEFRIDRIGALFAVMAEIAFLCAGFFSFEYMKRKGEEHEKRYYGFYLLTLGVIHAICFAGNLITFYLFFEMLTLVSMPLVLHEQSHEAVMAGLKYLFYSLCGAYMALFGLYFVYRYSETLRFTAGGVLGAEAAGQRALLLAAAFCMLLGFGVKAGMFPLHAWLPTAHPVAPAPASAVLSAVIVKAGVLAVVRTVYYIFGPAFLRGTWVQTVWLILVLLTVFMGSVLAYREDVLKKRLAYSTVSQVSYVLFGLALMNETSVTGGILQALVHGFLKTALFLWAGAVICQTGKTRASRLRGIGKEMPVMTACYTIVSLGLIGIPPTGGFAGKWYLAEGALISGLKGFAWMGPAVLLFSAVLTAGYLLPISIQGFFPGADYDYKALEKKEPSAWMLAPVILLTVISVVIGIWPELVTGWIERELAEYAVSLGGQAMRVLRGMI